MKDIAPQIIGAVTNEYLTNPDYSNFLKFLEFIGIPDDCVLYIHTVDNKPVINMAIEEENMISMPIQLLFVACPEFAEYYSVCSCEDIYKAENIAAFVVYYILNDLSSKEEPELDKEDALPLVKCLSKFVKPGNPKLDKFLEEMK